MSFSIQPRCALCQWNFDKVFRREYLVEYPGPLNYLHYLEKQLKYCDTKHLHARCAKVLMERERTVRKYNPGMPLRLTQFSVVSMDNFFSLRTPQDNYRYYLPVDETAKDEPEEETGDDDSEGEEFYFRAWE